MIKSAFHHTSIAERLHFLLVYHIKGLRKEKKTDSTYHGNIQTAHVGRLTDLAAHVWLPAQAQGGFDTRRARGVFDHLQAPGPGRRAHEPEEGEGSSHHKILQQSK